MKNTKKNNINIEKSSKISSVNEQPNSIGKKSIEKNEKDGKIIDPNKDNLNIRPIEQADIFLFLDFFENLNQNNLEKCQEILTTSNLSLR